LNVCVCRVVGTRCRCTAATPNTCPIHPTPNAFFPPPPQHMCTTPREQRQQNGVTSPWSGRTLCERTPSSPLACFTPCIPTPCLPPENDRFDMLLGSIYTVLVLFFQPN
jgi:hypothetical protein